MITLILWIAVIGALVWFITTYIPMPDVFKKGILVLAAIFVILLLLQAIGMDEPHVPKLLH